MKIFVDNSTNIINTINDAFEGNNISIGLKGVPNVNHVLQVNLIFIPRWHSKQVLNYWSYRYNMSFAQSGNGSKTVDGGIMPKVKIDVPANLTTPSKCWTLHSYLEDNLRGYVSLNLTLPFDYHIFFGSVQGKVVYLGTPIAGQDHSWITLE